MKILVTGAFGGIGTAVLTSGRKRGYSMSAFELDTRGNRKKAAALKKRLDKVFWGDLRRIDDVRKALEGQDAVIHLGAVIPPASEKVPELSYAVNVGGTENIIKAVGGANRSSGLVFASSVSVMGASADRKPPLKVGDPVRAGSHYSGQKIECEKMLRNSDIRWTVTRLGAVVNTDLSAGGASLKEMMSEVFAMSLENRIEGVWNIDAAEGLINAAVSLGSSDEIKGATFFIGGGKRNGWQLTVKEFYTAVFEALGFGMLNENCFSKEPYYADWLDTVESQLRLHYQNHTFEEFLTELRRKMGVKRFFAGLFAPAIRRGMERL